MLLKKFIVIVDGKEHVVRSTASEWFVLQSVLSHVKEKKQWNIYLDGHC